MRLLTRARYSSGAALLFAIGFLAIVTMMFGAGPFH
jgi:hypothetical protein